MPEKIIHEIRLKQYIACPADRTRRFSLGTKDSYGVEQLRIVPGEGWDGLMITATFHPPEGEAVQVIVPADGLIDVPPEATRSGSKLPIKYGKIVFAGVADGVQRISCNLPYTVMDHAPVDGVASSGPSPSWYEQATAHFLPDGGKAGQVLAKASDADLDVEWADGGNGTADHAKLSNRDASDQHPISAITGLENALDAKQPAGSYLTQESDPTVPDWAKQPEKPSYTADEVGADPSGTAASQVSAHNTGADTHSDIRLLIQGLTDRLNTLADSDDTTLDQLSEVVAYIKSNRGLIEAITTNKVSVSDIVDNLTTNASNKPLSAAQGVALKTLIEAISVPDKLPNPNALTFTGAVTGSYDGTAPLTVEIPQGGGDETNFQLVFNQECLLDADVGKYEVDIDFGLQDFKEFIALVKYSASTNNVYQDIITFDGVVIEDFGGKTVKGNTMTRVIYAKRITQTEYMGIHRSGTNSFDWASGNSPSTLSYFGRRIYPPTGKCQILRNNSAEDTTITIKLYKR